MTIRQGRMVTILAERRAPVSAARYRRTAARVERERSNDSSNTLQQRGGPQRLARETFTPETEGGPRQTLHGDAWRHRWCGDCRSRRRLRLRVCSGAEVMDPHDTHSTLHSSCNMRRLTGRQSLSLPRA